MLFGGVNKPVSLCDVTQLLVESGYVQSLDIYQLSQTCIDLFRTTNKDAIWAAFCHRDFPSGTKHIPQRIVAEKGYKWLYREWKRTIEQRRTTSYYIQPLSPPRLAADQLMLYVHMSMNERPIHDAPIVLTGIHLTPLLNTGRITMQLSEPIMLGPAVWDSSSFHVATSALRNGAAATSFAATCSRSIQDLQTRLHLLSTADVNMKCIFNQTSGSRNSDCLIKVQPDLHNSPTFTMESSMNLCTQEESHLDLGASVDSYYKCELTLRHSPAATEINSRFSSSIVFNVGTRFGLVEQEGKTYFAITAIDIKVWKYDRHSSSSLGTCDVFDCAQMKQNGEVTLLHYLSELQMS
jgi:hypothetical protein